MDHAKQLELQRNYVEAAKTLDGVFTRALAGSSGLRFQALLLRADLAVSLNELGEARGILSEAVRVPLNASERESLASELRRADDLETFLTHRGCAG